MKTYPYNFHEALELRGLTWLDFLGQEAYKSMPQDQWLKPISFKDSLFIVGAFDENHFNPPGMPLWMEVMPRDCRNVSKKRWKQLYSSYREYLTGGRDSDLDPAGGYGLHSHE